MTIEDKFLALQSEQQRHDDAYHRDIAFLPLHQRINHLALHFAKYTGKIARYSSLRAWYPTMTDSLLIALSTANALNSPLYPWLPGKPNNAVSVAGVGLHFAEKFRIDNDAIPSLLVKAAVATGQIADACEKIDHLEETHIPARYRILDGVGHYTVLALAVLAGVGFDPDDAIRDRHAGIASRSPLTGTRIR